MVDALIAFGPNQALVEEVLEFAEHGRLLAPTSQLSAPDWLPVRSLEEAEDAAYRRMTIPREGHDVDDEDGGLTWTDLRQKQASEILAVTYPSPELAPLRRARGELSQRIFGWLSRLDPAYSELVDDISADFANIALSRAVFGADPHRLFEKMFQAYRAGGWPCGWVGAFPAGQLVVYDPSP